MRSTLPFVLGFALCAVGCSETPLSPTEVGRGSAAATAPRLRWDLVAPGCTPRTPPSPIPETASARVSQEADGSIRASWDHVFPGGGTGLLYAKFVPSGTEWLLCFWDTASV